MGIDVREAFHVVEGEVAAGTLKAALGLSGERMIVNRDPVAVGPAPATRDRAAWHALRQRFLCATFGEVPEHLAKVYPGYGLVDHVETLARGAPVIAWASAGLPEQLLVGWLTDLYARHALDRGGLHLARVAGTRGGRPVTGIGELAPDALRALSVQPRALGAPAFEAYRDAWAAYTGSEPRALTGYLGRAPAPAELHAAMRTLIDRYPASRSGLSLLDEKILACTASDGPGAARIVATALAEATTPDRSGDRYVFARLLSLGRAGLAAPLVSVAGDTGAMRACSVRLTDFGRAVLAGSANAVAANGIDDWVGGVHLRGPRATAYRDDGTLVFAPPPS